MEFVKYLIIGGGISGLTFAVQKINDDYLILEKDSELGGLCKSFRDKGFVWDVAGHFFHFHSKETENYYNQLMGDRVQRRAEKHAKVYYGQKYMNAPFQYNIHQLDLEEFIECMTDLYFADNQTTNVAFDEYVRNKYGDGIANKFLIPYNEKLYACRMNDLECDSMGEFLPKLDFDMLMHFYRGLKGKTYNDTFMYPVDGCDGIIQALTEHLENRRIHLNESAESIDIENKIAITNKGMYRYEYLINTAPLVSFAEMSGCDGASCLTYNKVLVLNIGFDKESIDKEVSWVYFPGNEIFYRVGFYNNISGTERLSVYVEIGYSAYEDIDIEAALEKTVADLKRVKIIDDHKVVSYKPYVICPGYAHITAEGSNYTETLIAEMKKQDVHMIGRYARWQYSAMDDSIEQAIELSKLI